MRNTYKVTVSIFTMIVMLIGVLAIPNRVLAAGVVGTGTPGSCDEAALDARLSGGGAVTFNCGGAAHTIVLTSPKTISADTTIDGGNLITLDGNLTVQLFAVNLGVSLQFSNLTLQNGYQGGVGFGGVIDNNGTLTVNNVTFSNNRSPTVLSPNGGAIYNRLNATLTVSNSTFSNNYCGANGGAIYIDGGTSQVNITNTVFQNNNNPSINNGGAIYVNGGTVTISDSDFTNNGAGNFHGGAIFVDGGTVIIDTNSTFTSNTANLNGGAIRLEGGTLNISNSTFTGNNATRDGGAIAVLNGVLTITDSSFSSNTADDGGAIYHSAPTLLTITNSTFNSNQANGEADGDGGAITLVANASSATISGSTFSNNSSRDDGGAIYNDSQPATITNSTFVGNTANGENNDNALGGAIFNSDTADETTITLSTFSNNTAQTVSATNAFGGAIYNEGTRFTLANDTFTGNTARQFNFAGGDAQGGAIWSDAAIVDVYNVTFSGNGVSVIGTGTAAGGNLYQASGSVTLANTIVNSGSPDNCAGVSSPPVTNGGNNIDSGVTCGFPIADSNLDPNLEALTGSPAYFPLQSSSIAIDAGNNTVCASAPVLDQSQNGVVRPQGTACDIGSFEFQSQPPGEPEPVPVSEAVSLPATGFPLGKVTILPPQPVEKAYDTSTDLVLEIPSLNQSLTIVGVPQADGIWDVTWLGKNAGYLAGSAFPTWSGNTVITGHVWDAWDQPGPFAELKSLKYGDQFFIHAWGMTYTYEVRENRLLLPKRTDAAFQHEEYDWVTLLTCEFYNSIVDSYLFRHMVRAVLVSVK